MRIVFCDDDNEILEQLQAYVADFFARFGTARPEYAVYQSGETLLVREQQVDIAFLDVEMPGLSGINVGARLKQQNPNVKIFIVTAYPDYLDEAMRFQVFRYLSKPIDKNRLFRNLKDAIYQYNMETIDYLVETEEGAVVCRAEHIVCVETDGRRCRIHTINGTLDSTEHMEYWKNQLRLPCFYLSHRSFIINMKYVRSFDRDTILLGYRNCERKAYLTRRKYTQFKDSFLLYLESTK